MTILVTGATGAVGREVVNALLKSDQRVRALTRNPGAAKLPAGVAVFEGDLKRPESLAAAFAGVDRLYLFPVAETTQEVVAMAKRAGVRRIVVLSGATAEEESDSDPTVDGYRAVERPVEASGLEWTHVRPGEFAANWLDWAPSIRTERSIRRPYGDAVSMPTHEADIAAVATAALLEDGHAGERYTFHGPEALTMVDQVRAISAAIGEEIRFEEQEPGQARGQWIEDGYPAEVVDWLFTMWAESVRNPLTVDAQQAGLVQRVTGRPARTFAQWAADHAAAFR